MQTRKTLQLLATTSSLIGLKRRRKNLMDTVDRNNLRALEFMKLIPINQPQLQSTGMLLAKSVPFKIKAHVVPAGLSLQLVQQPHQCQFNTTLLQLTNRNSNLSPAHLLTETTDVVVEPSPTLGTTCRLMLRSLQQLIHTHQVLLALQENATLLRSHRE